MGGFLLVFSTIDNEDSAKKIADRLVSEKLAACVQIDGPIESVYRWQGRVEKTKEWRLNIKTRPSLYQKVEKTIKEIHPYEVPEIFAIPFRKGSREYLKWIEDSTKIKE